MLSGTQSKIFGQRHHDNAIVFASVDDQSFIILGDFVEIALMSFLISDKVVVSMKANGCINICT